MKDYSLSIQRFAYFLLVLVLSVYIAIEAKGILVPLFFAAFLAALLKPLSNFYERIIKSRAISIILAFFTALLPIFGLIAFFTYQILTVVGDVSSVGEKVKGGFYTSLNWVGTQLGWSPERIEQWATENVTTMIDAPLQFISEGLSSTSSMLVGLTLTLLFTFFLLLYRKPLKNFLLFQFDDKSRGPAIATLSRIEKVGRKYLTGLFYVILILGIANSIGLWIIGIRYAFFWGFLGAFLAIIPYVGTALGGLFPLLFAIASGGPIWQPIAIVAWYAMVQTLEGNIITPKIVGSSVKINPFAAIIALLIGGYIWGISGLLLALPMIAVLRIIFLQIDLLKPIGILLCDDMYERTEVFENDFNENRFRILNFFRKNR